MYSADQRSKYNEHLKQHTSRALSDSVSLQMSVKVKEDKDKLGDGVKRGNKVDSPESLKERQNTKMIDKTPSRKKTLPDKRTSSNTSSKQMMKEEVLY